MMQVIYMVVPASHRSFESRVPLLLQDCSSDPLVRSVSNKSCKKSVDIAARASASFCSVAKGNGYC
jgi:hypothetical protein